MPQRSWRAVAGSAALSLSFVALPRAQAPPAAPLDGWSVGFRTADGAVVVLIDEGGELYLPQRDFDKIPTSAQAVASSPSHLIDLPDSMTAKLVGEKAHVGDAWTIDVPQAGRFHATVQRFVLGYRNCGEAWGVLLRAVPAERDVFQTTISAQVLARPGTIEVPSGRIPGPVARTLTAAERAKIAPLLEAARVRTEADVRRQSSTVNLHRPATAAERAWMTKWTALDRTLDHRQGKLAFDATLYRLTPDGDPRVFVRAHWLANGEVAYALAAWVRLAPQPSIDQVDATPARALRFMDEGVDWDRAVPRVLAVFDVDADGRAEVLMTRQGYESSDHVLIEYPASPTEKPRELAHYGDGC